MEETLEEAAKKHATGKSSSPVFQAVHTLDFIAGALWQKQQDKKMYSEEDMQQYAIFCIRCYEQGLPCIIAKDWFEKFNNLNNK